MTGVCPRRPTGVLNPFCGHEVHSELPIATARDTWQSPHSHGWRSSGSISQLKGWEENVGEQNRWEEGRMRHRSEWGGGRQIEAKNWVVSVPSMPLSLSSFLALVHHPGPLITGTDSNTDTENNLSFTAEAQQSTGSRPSMEGVTHTRRLLFCTSL